MRFSVCLAWALCLGSGGLQAAATKPIDFSRDVQPILADNCFHCHGPDEQTRKGNLRLDVADNVFQSRDGVTPVVRGQPAQSELIRRITHTDPDEKMPPPDAPRQLKPAEIEVLRRWISEGAPWAQHWAFVSPTRPALPKVRNETWSLGPIDRFILAGLEREKLTPAPEAARATLLRRVSLDLTGLPPTLEELEAFLADTSQNAYEKVVDRLLASPRYGERMVWEWLEAARYADSNGYQGDPNRTMWHWRDWAIQALNDNMPFDQFTVEQLAGDLLPQPTVSQKVATGFHRNHMINAEGGRIEEESRVDYVQDRVETTSTVWLGLTMTCARCHDHKYDPITQREYYQLYAYFNNVMETGGADAWPNAKPILRLPSAAQTARIAQLETEEKQARAALETVEAKLRQTQNEWETSLTPKETPVSANPPVEEKAPQKDGPINASAKPPVLPENVRAILEVTAPDRTKEQRKTLEEFYFSSQPARTNAAAQVEKAIKALKDANAAVPVTMIMAERTEPRDSFILVRGAYDKFGEKVRAGVPAGLPSLPADSPPHRLALARWLVSPNHPLTARVTVNRYWQTFFGTGLVKTPEDFGIQGEKPSHPELLDWLATEFVASGWDVKALHKQMVMSATYRQSSRVTPTLLEQDPENRWLARGPRFRLPSWMLRDQALFISGLLVEQTGGKPVKPYQPPGVWEDATFGQIVYQQDRGEKLYRRSLYTFWRRIVGPTMFFDVANRQNCAVRQPRTNTPLHALATMNDVTYVEASRALAERLLRGGRTDQERIALGMKLCVGRAPSDPEARVLKSSLERLRQEFAAQPEEAKRLLQQGEFKANSAYDSVELAAHTGLGNLLLNLDETLNKE